MISDNFQSLRKYKINRKGQLSDFDLAAAFHQGTGNRELMVSLMTPLYHARVASFVNRTRDMDNVQAEEIVEEQAQVFENLKDYLIQCWDEDIDYYH